MYIPIHVDKAFAQKLVLEVLVKNIGRAISDEDILKRVLELPQVRGKKYALKRIKVNNRELTDAEADAVLREAYRRAVSAEIQHFKNGGNIFGLDGKVKETVKAEQEKYL